MPTSGEEIYLVHAIGCDCDYYFDSVETAYTTLSGAVNYIERVMGAIEQPTRGSREWRRWKLYKLRGDQCPYWGPLPDDDEMDEDSEEPEPTYPFDYVFRPYEYDVYNIGRIVLDSDEYEEEV